MNHVEYILKLQKEAKEDFWLSSLNDDGSNWKKWKKVSETTFKEKEQANNRSILSYEIIGDIETKEKKIIDEIKGELNKNNISYELWDSGGKGCHFKLVFLELKKIPKGSRPKIKEFILGKCFLGYADLQKVGNKCMISMEYAPHRKTGKRKTLIESKDNGENKFNQQILDFIKKPEEDKKKKSEDEEEAIQKSFLEINGHIYEQVEGLKYIYKKGDGFEFTNFVDIGGVKFMPCGGEELDDDCRVVLLPSEAKDYGDIQDLIKEIKEFIHEWVDVSPEYETFASWYVLLSWVYDCMPTINYLSAMGDTGTGKSRFLDTIGRICYKAIIGSGGVTVAAVKRIINKWKGSLIIDEGDFKEGDETVELIKLFNLGFERNKRMFNCDKNDPSKLEFFDPYCPKIIARRRQFKDQALEARCLTEVMQQTTNKKISPLLTKKFYEKQAELRNKLLKFRFDYYYNINIDKVLEIDLGEVEPRIKQATIAFTTLFFNIPEALDNFRRFIKDYNSNIIEERASSFDGLIVNSIIDLIIEGSQYITSQDILNDLQAIKGIKTTTRTIGSHLKQLGLKTVSKKVEGKSKRVVPLGNRFFEIVKRYCSDLERVQKVTEVTLVTTATSTCGNTENQAILTNNKKSEVDVTNVTDVTDVTKKNEVKPSENDLIEFVREKKEQGYPTIEFIEKYGENVLKRLLSNGGLIEVPNGTLRVLE